MGPTVLDQPLGRRPPNFVQSICGGGISWAVGLSSVPVFVLTTLKFSPSIIISHLSHVPSTSRGINSFGYELGPEAAYLCQCSVQSKLTFARFPLLNHAQTQPSGGCKEFHMIHRQGDVYVPLADGHFTRVEDDSH